MKIVTVSPTSEMSSVVEKIEKSLNFTGFGLNRVIVMELEL